MDVLFFCPTKERANAGPLLGILQKVVSETGLPRVDVFDENSPAGGLENKKYDAAVIVYSSDVELSNCLFEVVRYIDQEKPLGRFIFLPKSGGKEIIPTIFHPIRALQLQLFYYSLAEPLEIQLGEFEQDWQGFVLPLQPEQPGKKGRSSRARQAGFGLILTASIFILFLAGLIAEIVPIMGKTVLNLTPTAIRPPAATVFWLQESFQSVDTTNRWQEQHYYTGQQAMQLTFPGAGLRFSADPVVTDAFYQLESLQSWPLDELESLSFSFALAPLDDPAAKNALNFSLTLSEDNSYHMDCVIIPAKTEGKIQCQILSPVQTEALSEAIPFSLGSPHTASLVFDPLTYSVQFFLDDQYHGRAEIQSVQYWRARKFNLLIRDELQNMSSGSYSCELDSLELAHQP